MDVHKWFDVSLKKHHHRWGPWILMNASNIKFNHRMIQGQVYTAKRTCQTCGQEEFGHKERKLDIERKL